MRKSLTARFCETIKASSNRVEVVDTSPRSWNLTFRVTPNAKSWAVRYRIDGKRQRITLGAFPGVSLERARKKSLAIAALVADGVDPKETEAEERKASKTFGIVVNEYINDHCRKHQRSWQQTARIFERWVLPSFGDIALQSLDRGKVLELLHDLEKVGLTTQVNRILSQIKACLSWAVEEREYLPVNPIATLYRKKRRVKEESRERVLNNDELKTLWQVTAHLTDPSRSFIRMMMLTGQRRDEVRLMKWSELDFETRTWLLPAIRTKPKREHLVPLSSESEIILRNLPRIGEFVFTVNGRKPYAGQRRLKQILDREGKLTDWILHDIRRTVGTGLSALKIAPHVRRRCLNHATGDSLDRVYDRHDFVDEKRMAFDTWAEHLLVVVGEKDASNITQLHAAR